MFRTTRLIAGLALLALAAALLPPPAGTAAQSPPSRITGIVVTADGGEARALRVFARSGSWVDSAEVDAIGRFSVRVPETGRGDAIELLVDAADQPSRSYFPALVRVRREELADEYRFVLIPRRWTIPSGRYMGLVVSVSLHRAFSGACGGCPAFLQQEPALASMPGQGPVQTWPAAMFPLRVAFDRGYSGSSITARDSAAFWRIAEAMERDFGSDLFQPARYEETLPDELGGPDDVILVAVDPALNHAGLGGAVSQRGDIIYGSVQLQRASLISSAFNRHIVTHELMHALGVGHTCAWRSLMAANARCLSQQATYLTAEDIAHVQVAAQARARQHEHGARWGMEAALAGERMLLLGLPLKGTAP